MRFLAFPGCAPRLSPQLLWEAEDVGLPVLGGSPMLVDRIRVHGFINIISADEVVIIPCDLQNAAAGVMLFQNWLAHASNKVRDNNTSMRCRGFSGAKGFRCRVC